MINFRMPIFLFLSCVSLHKSEILDPDTLKICTKPECEFVALIASQYMDPTVSPCDDFNKFVCGTFLNKTIVPEGKRSLDRYDIITDKITEELKGILEEASQPNEPRWTTLAKNYYSSCTHIAEVNRNGLRGVFRDLKELGGWPILEKSWNPSNYEWKSATYTMQKLGYGASFFFNFEIIADPLNSTKYVISIDSPYFTLSSDDLIQGLNNPMVIAYLDYMVDLAVIFGANRENARKELKESLCFEINLAMISHTGGDSSNENDLNIRKTVKDLSKDHPSIPWKVYFNKLYSVIKSKIVIEDDEPILVGSNSFFTEFEKLIKNTPKRVLANFHMWKIVHSNTNFLTEEIRLRRLAFENMRDGENITRDRRQHCFEETIWTYLRWSVGALYVRSYFGPESKKSAEELAVAIERQFKKMIIEAEWMDEISKQNALKRVASLNNFMGYPKEFFDDNILNEFYKEAEASPTDFFKAASSIALFCYSYDFNKLRTIIDPLHWTLHGESYIAGSSFSYDGNGPDVFAGVLQDIFFRRNALMYMNFASIGTFNIAAIAAYLFIDVDSYMTPETKKIYLEKADCITYQYGNYTAKEVGLKLNGTNTLVYNILDNIGINAAYLAYQEWAERNLPEPQLRGLTGYSIRQIFWILVGLQQCAKYTPDFLEEVIQTFDFSPSEFRIIGPLSNSREFAADFHCDCGTKMNPPNKCTLW